MEERLENENSLGKKWELVNFCEFDKYATASYCAIHNVDESLNLGDITKVDESRLPHFTMMCGGSPCFVAGTKVITKDGYKNIEDIKIGDMVLTHKNRYKSVVGTGGEQDKEIYSLRIQGFLNTECTDYHPFYCKKTKVSEPEKIKLKDLRVGYYLGSHINHNEDNRFNLSDEDCWILGRYVADGHIRKDKRKERKNSFQYQCILSIGDNKVDELKSIVKTRHYNCYPHSKSTYRVVFSSMELVNFIIEHGFGMGSENKNIPSFILDLPVSKLECFLNGYMSGDGCKIGNVYQATTVSKELAMSLCVAIQKVYRVGCCVYYTERPDTCVIENRVVNQKDTYMIRFRKNSQKHLWFIEDNIVWYPIREITKTDKVENVFNIEVEEDHTYTANNIITYNCQDFSVAGKQKGSVWTCKDCGEIYNPLTVHWSERGKCPCCGSNNIEKTRSSLLVEYLRIIRSNKPSFGMYENVKNIVGKQFKDTTFKLFTNELEEYGYNVYWKVLNAKNYGIPQNRERVYLIFIKKDLDNGQFKFPDPFDNGIRLKDILEDVVDEKFYVSEEKTRRLLENINNKTFDGTNDNSVQQIGNILECKGNWKNPQVGRIYSPNGCSPTLNTCSGGSHEPKIIQVGRLNSSQDGVVVSPNGITPTHVAGHGDTPKIIQLGNINPSGKGMNGNVFDADGLAPTVTTNKGEGSKIAIRQATKKGYIECEIGGVADLSYPESKTRRGRVQDGGNICPTLTATETGVCKIESPIRIRKLTPRECFRLMGFSDEAFNATEKVCSNSQLYKQSGNSIVVDVLYYILVELYKAMPYLFTDLRLGSFFSGIGAFEAGLDRLYESINRGEL